ncbi:MAG: DUF1385 domain-containing protein [Acetivibrio sp.]
MKPSGIGGQAVIEGVMMKNQDVYAIAVRKPDKTIDVKKEEYVSIQKKYKFTKLPIIRGVVSFVESMVIGMKTLTYSASFFEEEETKPTKLEENFGKIFKGKAESVIMGFTVCLSILIAVGVFMILPFFIAEIFKKMTDNTTILAVIEGIIRITIFIAYAVLISFVKDIKRVFMYHGAEHKTINCVENGLPLTVSNVKKQSKHHKRCGTSFMLVVMFISILFFIFIRVDNMWLRVLYRILLVPVIAGISYEFIRLAGKGNSPLVNLFSKPGMWMQALTTKEPDDSMIEVAIASVEAVFDWEKYQKEERMKETSNIKIDKMETETAVTEDKIKVVKKTVKKAEEKNNNITKKEVNFGEKPKITEDEEEDEILNALDKFFVFKEEKKEP